MLSSLWFRLGSVASAMTVAPKTFGAVFDGPGLVGGKDTASEIDGPSDKPIREIIVEMLKLVLDFLALIAVIMIILAGLYLLFSNGNEEQKNKAKTILKYVIFGLILIMLVRVIVSFFTVLLPKIIG